MDENKLTRMTADLNIIYALDDEPNDVGGMSAAELKARFDQSGLTIQRFINEVLLPELEGAQAAQRIGALAQDEKTESTVQNELKKLNVAKHTHAKPDDQISKAVNDSHTHNNKSLLDQITAAFTTTLATSYNRLVTLLLGIDSVTKTLGTDDTTIPTSKAVSDAITSAGALPAGGQAGQALVKASDENYDLEWGDSGAGSIPSEEKGVAGGVATLDDEGKVPGSQLPAMDYAPMYTYGTTDLTAGTSPLESGKLHFVYE